MRHKHKKVRKIWRDKFVKVLTIVSHVAAIAGTIVVMLDTLHHW